MKTITINDPFTSKEVDFLVETEKKRAHKQEVRWLITLFLFTFIVGWLTTHYWRLSTEEAAMKFITSIVVFLSVIFFAGMSSGWFNTEEKELFITENETNELLEVVEKINSAEAAGFLVIISMQQRNPTKIEADFLKSYINKKISSATFNEVAEKAMAVIDKS